MMFESKVKNTESKYNFHPRMRREVKE